MAKSEYQIVGKKKRFDPGVFTPTKWKTAEDKATWCTRMVAFILADFAPWKFKKGLYQPLSNMYMHIAHYNLEGFYEVWFRNWDGRYRWCLNAQNHPKYGDPTYTWCDAEQELVTWLLANDIEQQCSDQAAKMLEMKEIAHLQRLQEKYKDRIIPVEVKFQQKVLFD